MSYARKHTATPLLMTLLAALPFCAQAAPVPDAGSLLQQIKPAAPPAPSPAETGLTIRNERGEKLPPSAPFLVKSIKITGNTLFDTATLHALVADAEGKPLSLSQLDELAAKIADYYHNHDYLLARAIIPAQTIHDGIVEIRVIEAQYGKVSLDNKSRVKDGLLQNTLSPLKSGDNVEQKALDHSLLLLSDIPGVVVNATLIPGESVGTSDLLVNATPGPSVTGNVALDNYGNKYTGRARAGGSVNFINTLHYGDVLSLSGLSSGSGMNYGRVSYDTIVNGLGTHLGGAVSALHYILGDTFSNLNGHGTAQVESLWAKHPLIRSRNVNLYGQVQYDHLNLQDHIDASNIKTDRHLDNWTGSFSGDYRDGVLSGSVNTWNLALTSGHVAFDDSAAQLADAATARTQGGFTKWNGSYSRLQGLSQNNSLYVALSGQWTNDNLDASQQMVAGGPYTVRAYDMGVLSGDTGYLGSAELRHDMGSLGQGQWQAVAFLDSEHVIVNQNTWVAGENSATLNGAGAGLNWTGVNQWDIKAYLAKRLGSAPVLVANASSTRVWVEIGKGF